jgi:hypothetical protein
MILFHHGGELPLLAQALVGAGTVGPMLLLMRERLRDAGGRLRRRLLRT